MSSRNIETTKRGYDAFNAGDLEAALSAFHDSAVWIVNGESTIGGTYHGKAELAELFRRLGEKAPTVEPKRYLESGDAVVVLTSVTVEGETYHEADLFRFDNGKLIKAQAFGDTAALERIFGSKRVTVGSSNR